jgi:hypothetical protein
MPSRHAVAAATVSMTTSTNSPNSLVDTWARPTAAGRALIISKL